MKRRHSTRRPVITVLCVNCGNRVNEKKVKFVNIEEDMVGRDVLTFMCPNCGKKSKSLRYS